MQKIKQSSVTTSVTTGASDAFKSGYAAGYENKEHMGWKIEQAPQEETIIDTIQTMACLLREDDWQEYEVRWCAGLLAGWFERKGETCL